MSLSQAQLPAVISCGVIAFVAGGAIGAFTMMYLGYDPRTKDLLAGKGETQVADDKGGPPPGMKGGPPGGGKGGGPPGGGKGGGPPGGTGGAMLSGMGAANPKMQLTTLVSKLNQLTAKPLAVTLNDDQRSKLSEQLKGLSEEEELNEDDAKKRLDAILEIVQGQKETLEAAGFRWPGAGGGFQRPPDTPNPFAEGENKDHLKQLEERLSKSKSK